MKALMEKMAQAGLTWLADEPMKKHTTFQIGGPADLFVVPQSVEELKTAVHLCKEAGVPMFILGNGSNLLVSDAGYRGCVIQIGKALSEVVVEGTAVRAGAGAMLRKICDMACKAGLSGLEFACGIPGTLGGAMVMNAGAYGGEMVQVVKTCTVLTADGEIKVLPVEELALGYRTSCILEKHYIVLETEMMLTPGDQTRIRAKMDELLAQRRAKQPLEFPSAGSTFKRPEGYFAGKLIQDAGLRGFSVGGACVSEKHCGFVVNKGGATCADVISLCEQVSERVYAQFGVRLEREIKVLGD